MKLYFTYNNPFDVIIDIEINHLEQELPIEHNQPTMTS